MNVADVGKSGGLMYDRRVTRTISRGTLIDENFINPYENNFLLAVGALRNDESAHQVSDEAIPVELKDTRIPSFLLPKRVGLAWVDLSTGDFFTQDSNIGSLPSVVARVGAKEVVITDENANRINSGVLKLLEQQRSIITHHHVNPMDISVESWTPMLESEVPEPTKSALTIQEVFAGSLLLSYVRKRLPGLGIKLQIPIQRHDKEIMRIDKNSMRALEILGTSREALGGGKGSLLHTVRRTVTKSGARLLRAWITLPSMSLQTINSRLDLVSQFLENPSFKEEMVNVLKRTHDSQRLVHKFSMGKGDANDLIKLRRTIEATNEISLLIKKMIMTIKFDPREEGTLISQKNSLLALNQRLSVNGPKALSEVIMVSVDEESLMESHAEDSNSPQFVTMEQEALGNEFSADDQAALPLMIKSKSKPVVSNDADADVQDRWVLRRTASNVLEVLHNALNTLQLDKAELANRLQEELQARSLTLRWTPGLGYICHIKGAHEVASSLKKSSATRNVKTTKSTRSFHHPDWISLGGRIDQAKMRIKAEELGIMQDLRGQVIGNLIALRRNATVLDELDIACSFATLADEQDLVRPVLNTGRDHNIVGGRHPTVKVGLEEQGRAFISNDCQIGSKERIWLITGPNMAGKSTFLRQNALITILAQVGSFVPAERAEIGLVDQIFTRIGSADNLFRDQSTFMVEMMETATILNDATPQSFVIMDEIGRGTTPEDGLAVSFACLHHLYQRNQCRTLFATHFHSLADMTEDFEHLGCYCTDVAEGAGDSFSFIHRLRPGVNRRSHALKVAALAGVPTAAIETALRVLYGSRVDGPAHVADDKAYGI